MYTYIYIYIFSPINLTILFTGTWFTDVIIMVIKVHIIYMGEKHHEDPTVVEEFHYDMLEILLGR